MIQNRSKNIISIAFLIDSEEKPERKLRTQNLFYVECSRAKENLVVLMLLKIDAIALQNIKNWFGEDNVIDVEEILVLQ